MACATLKRSHDFDPVHNHVNPTKRQRCAPMVISPSSSPPGSRSDNYNSVFAGVCPKMSPGMFHSQILFVASSPVKITPLIRILSDMHLLTGYVTRISTSQWTDFICAAISLLYYLLAALALVRFCAINKCIVTAFEYLDFMSTETKLISFCS